MSDMQDKYKTVWTARFKKEYKRAVRRGQKIGKLDDIIRLLAKDTELPESLCDHELKGNWKNHRELHIEGDWLLIRAEGFIPRRLRRNKGDETRLQCLMRTTYPDACVGVC